VVLVEDVAEDDDDNDDEDVRRPDLDAFLVNPFAPAEDVTDDDGDCDRRGGAGMASASTPSSSTRRPPPRAQLQPCLTRGRLSTPKAARRVEPSTGGGRTTPPPPPPTVSNPRHTWRPSAAHRGL
jgi:hypothetical protein